MTINALTNYLAAHRALRERDAALHGALLTVTHLGRSISSNAKGKHCIKRTDKRQMQLERLEVYSALTRRLSGASNARYRGRLVGYA